MKKPNSNAPHDAERMFERATELLGPLSARPRLRSVIERCHGGLNVGQVLERSGTPLPHMAERLAMLAGRVHGPGGARARRFIASSTVSARRRCAALCESTSPSKTVVPEWRRPEPSRGSLEH